MNDLQLRLPEQQSDRLARAHPPIGRLLVDRGIIAPKDLHHALHLQRRIDAPLGEILLAEGLVQKSDVLDALASQAGTQQADLARNPPKPELAANFPAFLCLAHGAVPWREDKDTLFVATRSPTDFQNLQQALGSFDKTLFPVIVDDMQIQSQQSRLYGSELAEQALIQVPESESCRTWNGQAQARIRWACFALAVLLLCSLIWPAWTLTIGIIWAVVTLVMTTALKAAALVSHFTRGLPAPFLSIVRSVRQFLPRFNAPPDQPELSLIGTTRPSHELTLLPAARADAALRMTDTVRAASGRLPMINAGETAMRMPRVSMLVPLLHEREIAGQLIARLSRLTYPKSLLEVILVLEENDDLTRNTIARTDLPDWMRVIEVPEGSGLTTKPRALNYALNFCKGTIVGVWDAEDWPEADQIEKVVSGFHAAPDDVVCLQGVLDYYNSRSSWLARCFTIEYAIWWRIVMPGIARLGLMVPLGGTTLFFRKSVLEELGGWDAHNVTEDADLGVRLARHGYKTELLDTVTREEATGRAWPWVRQRSRWLKGFLVTYLVHMRHPRALMRDVGFWRFMGLQTIFLAAVSQFAAAPLLWSFWLTLLGGSHPVESTLGAPVVWALAGFFIFSEVLGFLLGLVALSARDRRHLIPFLPSMMVYFTLGAVAAYKALWELIRVPFFWDKTQHGVSAQTDPMPEN